MKPVASCIPFPFSAPCDDTLAMLVCASRWLSMHIYTLAHMFMHESCLLVCHPYFNTMKLWTSNPNLHSSLTDTTFCFLSYLFVFFLVCLLACLLSYFLDCLFILWLVMSLAICYACHVYHAYMLYASFICSLHLFLPLLVYWFLVLAFACTHMKRGRMELGHDLPGACKKGEDVSLLI